MNHYKEIGNITIGSSDESMLTCDENDDYDYEDSDYSVSSEILLPRVSKRKDSFNRIQEFDTRPIAHSSKESNFLRINYEENEKLSLDVQSLTTQFCEDINITSEKTEHDICLEEKNYNKCELIVSDTSDEYRNLQNVKIDNSLENENISSKVLKNNLIKHINDFDTWVSNTYLPQVGTLKANSQKYNQCWKKLNTLKGKLNIMCRQHIEQESTQAKKKVTKKECVSNMSSNIEKNNAVNKVSLKTLNKKSVTVGKSSDVKCKDILSKPLSITPEIYYPQDIMKKVKQIEGEINCKTIQLFSGVSYRCLLCLVMINGESNVLLHVNGKCHKDNLKNVELMEFVKTYHDVWSKFTNDVQLHQIYFFPGKDKFLNCVLCKTIIYPPNIIEHVAGRNHTEKLSMQERPLFQKKLLRSESVSSVSSTATQNSKSNKKNNIKKTNTQASKTVIKSSKNDSPVNVIKNLREKPDSNVNAEVIKLSAELKRELQQLNNIDNDYEHSVSSSDINKNNKDGSSLLDKKKDIWNTVPERLYFNKKIVKVFDSYLYCELCKVTPVDLLKHIASKTHEESLKKAPPQGYQEFTYFCAMCTKTFLCESKWQSHLSESDHIEKCKLSKKNSKFKVVLTEQICKECKNILFGDGNATLLHNHVLKKKKKDFKLPFTVRKLYSSISELELHSEKLLRVAESVLLQDSKDIECCQALAKSLQKEFPGCVGYRFGSRVSGLGNEFSDLDVFLDTGNMYNGLRNQDPKIQANLVRITFRALWKNFEWDGLEPIPLARTPIIRAYYKPTDLDCDISFKHGLSVENTKLLSLYMNMQPITRRMILSLKYWSQECHFHLKISSYAISLLAIFYLQTEKYLYSVIELRNMYKGPVKSIAGWDCTFFDDIGKIEIEPCLLSLPELLQDFFKFCVDYKFETMVVCPLMGISVPKEDFHNENGVNLPKEMKQYIDNLQNMDPDSEIFRSLSPMCIQDPFDLSHNLTKACTQNVVTKFKSACSFCYKLLEQQTSKLKNKN